MRLTKLLAWLAFSVCTSLGCACSIGREAPPAANTAAQAPAATECTQQCRLVGLLTLKGTDMQPWWAVTEDRGVVWQLEPASVEQAAQFRQWQNSRVAIEGIRIGAVLLTPRLQVQRAQLLR